MRAVEPEKKIETSEADQRGQGRKPEVARVSGSNFPGSEDQAGPEPEDLIERMFERGNLLQALQAVEANQGAAGIDGLEVGQLRSHLRERWAEIKEQILNGTYEPRAVRRVDIPKPGGGTRMLGIPTVLDADRVAVIERNFKFDLGIPHSISKLVFESAKKFNVHVIECGKSFPHLLLLAFHGLRGDI